MTYDPVTPNAGQSPGVFPTGNNTNFARLKTIINADHVFNDTAQADDGAHRKMTMVNLSADPVALPAGTNGIVYSKVVSGETQMFFYNGVRISQFTSGEVLLTGTVAVTSAFSTIVAIPANMFGEVYLYKARFIQVGAFVSDASVVNGYSYAEKFESGSGASQILRLGFDASGASGLNLRVRNDSSSSFDGTWTYKIFYRPK